MCEIILIEGKLGCHCTYCLGECNSWTIVKRHHIILYQEVSSYWSQSITNQYIIPNILHRDRIFWQTAINNRRLCCDTRAVLHWIWSWLSLLWYPEPHDDVIKWKHFPRYWSFVRGIHRSPVNSTHKGQWRGALMFSLICAWINAWVNNREAGDLRRYRAHYDVTVMRK